MDHPPAQKCHEIKIILDAYELCREQRNILIEKIHEQIRRVRDSLLAANMIPNSRWAEAVDANLYKIQDEIIL